MPRTRQSSRQGSSGQGSSGQGSARRQGSTRRARSSRAGLTLSVSLVEHLLREAGHASQLRETAPILLTAVLEFMVRRVLELAINEAQRRGAEMFITPELLDFTVYNNTPLSELFQFTTISHVPLPEPGRRRSSRRRQ
ncbi:histone H2A-Bbd type 2/3-like [Microtus oregoni]|uniref:histone H2A-Bbd type 2/3-like n=1 Tax=Microtus oregoni TaxID=111838 RepID=UPI001BB16EA4|nr:histone H2A-Bbd type 2/3-like [Microtus oregoni]XP_041492799.1 histone H2A-Bbd type 2/3-like [Microtus oregoni]